MSGEGLAAREALVEHLRAHGHWVASEHAFDELLAIYLNVLKRRIACRPRPAFRSRELAARAFPVALENVLSAIEAISLAGGDLNVFLHRRLRVEPAFEDRTLEATGLHHLHLGSATPLSKTGLTKRSRDVLFAFATDEGLYLVDVRPHGRKARLQIKRARKLRGEPGPIDARDWTVDEGLLEIARANWPGPFEASRSARAELTCPAPSSGRLRPVFEGFELAGWTAGPD